MVRLSVITGKIGDKIKISTHKADPDNRYHGMEGKIVDISFDDAGVTTGNPENNFMYKVKLENSKVPDIHFRRKDLIPFKAYNEKMKGD